MRFTLGGTGVRRGRGRLGYTTTLFELETVLIKETTKRTATFCELHEHPGGRKGGQFPQDLTYSVRNDGSVALHVEAPQDPSCSLCDLPDATWVPHTAKKLATEHLEEQLENVRQDAKTLELLIEAFKSPSEFVVYFNDEVFEG